MTPPTIDAMPQLKMLIGNLTAELALAQATIAHLQAEIATLKAERAAKEPA